METAALVSFDFDPDEPFGCRVVKVCQTALVEPMGYDLRRPYYAQFMACGFSPSLQNGANIADIRRIRLHGEIIGGTTCGIFARAAWHWPGRIATKPGRVGWPIMGGWLRGLNMAHPAWVFSGSGMKPSPGSIIYRAYSAHSDGREGHVQIVLTENDSGKWDVAQGGGGTDGSLCRISAGVKIFSKDSRGRIAVGWWDANKIAKIEGL